MALNIKDPETERLAHELARTTGESITVATRVALAQRLQRVKRTTAAGADAAELQNVISRGRDRGTLNIAPGDEGVGYDEDGLPR